MVKVTITDDVGQKLFFSGAVEIRNYVEDRAYTQVVLFKSGQFEKVNTLFLDPGDLVFIEECDND